ncbi:uncharacterized protein LOC142226901 [Haematobia irritans]|uniref:uncharacterized protein LOC142226901 n=1 Tax=Haematobia irritans TaxID=7368 RepID=UPI003F501A3C
MDTVGGAVTTVPSIAAAAAAINNHHLQNQRTSSSATVISNSNQNSSNTSIQPNDHHHSHHTSTLIHGSATHSTLIHNNSNSSSTSSSGYDSTSATPTGSTSSSSYDTHTSSTTPVIIAETTPQIPIVTVAPVSPFYSEAINTQALNETQHYSSLGSQHTSNLLTHHHHLTIHNQQQQQQQQQQNPTTIQPFQQQVQRQTQQQYSYSNSYDSYVPQQEQQLLQQQQSPLHDQQQQLNSYLEPNGGPAFEASNSTSALNTSGSNITGSYQQTMGHPYKNSVVAATLPYDRHSGSRSGTTRSGILGATYHELTPINKSSSHSHHSQQYLGHPNTLPPTSSSSSSSSKSRSSSSSLLGSSLTATSSTASSKPQAAATPFYAQPLSQPPHSNNSTSFYDQFKHKVPLDYQDNYGGYQAPYHQQQKYYAAAKSQLKEAANYGASSQTAAALAGKSLYHNSSGYYGSGPTPAQHATAGSGLPPSGAGYDKYIYPGSYPALSYEGSPAESAYRKVSAGSLSSSSWPWGLDYASGNSRTIPPPPSGTTSTGHLPTATVAPTHASYLAANTSHLAREPYYMTHDKYGVKYDKYASPYQQTSAYVSPPSARHHLWPPTHTSHLNERLNAAAAPPPPPHGPHPIHAGAPYFPATNTAPPAPPTAINARQSCCTQPYAPQNCYYPPPPPGRITHGQPVAPMGGQGASAYMSSSSGSGHHHQQPHLGALSSNCKYDYTTGNKLKTPNDLYHSSHYESGNPPPSHHLGHGHHPTSYQYASSANTQLYNTNQMMVHGHAQQPAGPMIANDGLAPSSTYANDLSLPSTANAYDAYLHDPNVQAMVGGSNYGPTSAKRALLDYRKPIQPQPPPVQVAQMQEDCYRHPSESEVRGQSVELLNTPENTASAFNDYAPEASTYGSEENATLDHRKSTEDSNKTVTLRDFIANWNDDEEEFAAANEVMTFEDESSQVINEVIQCSSLENPANIEASTPPTASMVEKTPPPVISKVSEEVQKNFSNSPVPDPSTLSETDASQYVNLPDIVIDIEKSNVNSSIATPPEPLAEAGSLSLDDFDVEKELDQLQQMKKSEVDSVIVKPNNADDKNSSGTRKVKSKSPENVRPPKEIRSLPTQLSFDDLNLESNSTKSVLPQATTNTDIEGGYDSGSSRHSNESSLFEKEYETFINKFSSNNEAVSKTDKEFEQKVQDFSKFHKRKRKLKVEETNTAVAAASFEEQHTKKLKSVDAKDLDDSNFPRVYTRKSRIRRSRKLALKRLKLNMLRRRKPSTFYCKLMYSLWRYRLNRDKRLLDNITEVREKHLPLIKRRSIKNYPLVSLKNSTNLFNPLPLKNLVLKLINTDEFRGEFMVTTLEQVESVPVSEEKHICVDPSCDTCEVIRSLMESDQANEETPEPCNDIVQLSTLASNETGQISIESNSELATGTTQIILTQGENCEILDGSQIVVSEEDVPEVIAALRIEEAILEVSHRQQENLTEDLSGKCPKSSPVRVIIKADKGEMQPGNMQELQELSTVVPTSVDLNVITKKFQPEEESPVAIQVESPRTTSVIRKHESISNEKDAEVEPKRRRTGYSNEKEVTIPSETKENALDQNSSGETVMKTTVICKIESKSKDIERNIACVETKASTTAENVKSPLPLQCLEKKDKVEIESLEAVAVANSSIKDICSPNAVATTVIKKLKSQGKDVPKNTAEEANSSKESELINSTNSKVDDNSDSSESESCSSCSSSESSDDEEEKSKAEYEESSDSSESETDSNSDSESNENETLKTLIKVVEKCEKLSKNPKNLGNRLIILKRAKSRPSREVKEISRSPIGENKKRGKSFNAQKEEESSISHTLDVEAESHTRNEGKQPLKVTSDQDLEKSITVTAKCKQSSAIQQRKIASKNFNTMENLKLSKSRELSHGQSNDSSEHTNDNERFSNETDNSEIGDKAASLECHEEAPSDSGNVKTKESSKISNPYRESSTERQDNNKKEIVQSHQPNINSPKTAFAKKLSQKSFSLKDSDDKKEETSSIFTTLSLPASDEVELEKLSNTSNTEFKEKFDHRTSPKTLRNIVEDIPGGPSSNIKIDQAIEPRKQFSPNNQSSSDTTIETPNKQKKDEVIDLSEETSSSEDSESDESTNEFTEEPEKTSASRKHTSVVDITEDTTSEEDDQSDTDTEHSKADNVKSRKGSISENSITSEDSNSMDSESKPPRMPVALKSIEEMSNTNISGEENIVEEPSVTESNAVEYLKPSSVIKSLEDLQREDESRQSTNSQNSTPPHSWNSGNSKACDALADRSPLLNQDGLMKDSSKSLSVIRNTKTLYIEEARNSPGSQSPFAQFEPELDNSLCSIASKPNTPSSENRKDPFSDPSSSLSKPKFETPNSQRYLNDTFEPKRRNKFSELWEESRTSEDSQSNAFFESHMSEDRIFEEFRRTSTDSNPNQISFPLNSNHDVNTPSDRKFSNDVLDLSKDSNVAHETLMNSTSPTTQEASNLTSPLRPSVLENLNESLSNHSFESHPSAESNSTNISNLNSESLEGTFRPSPKIEELSYERDSMQKKPILPGLFEENAEQLCSTQGHSTSSVDISLNPAVKSPSDSNNAKAIAPKSSSLVASENNDQSIEQCIDMSSDFNTTSPNIHYENAPELLRDGDDNNSVGNVESQEIPTTESSEHRSPVPLSALSNYCPEEDSSKCLHRRTPLSSKETVEDTLHKTDVNDHSNENEESPLEDGCNGDEISAGLSKNYDTSESNLVEVGKMPESHLSGKPITHYLPEADTVEESIEEKISVPSPTHSKISENNLQKREEMFTQSCLSEEFISPSTEKPMRKSNENEVLSAKENLCKNHTCDVAQTSFIQRISEVDLNPTRDEILENVARCSQPTNSDQQSQGSISPRNSPCNLTEEQSSSEPSPGSSKIEEDSYNIPKETKIDIAVDSYSESSSNFSKPEDNISKVPGEVEETTAASESNLDVPCKEDVLQNNSKEVCFTALPTEEQNSNDNISRSYTPEISANHEEETKVVLYHSFETSPTSMKFEEDTPFVPEKCKVNFPVSSSNVDLKSKDNDLGKNKREVFITDLPIEDHSSNDNVSRTYSSEISTNIEEGITKTPEGTKMHDVSYESSEPSPISSKSEKDISNTPALDHSPEPHPNSSKSEEDMANVHVLDHSSEPHPHSSKSEEDIMNVRVLENSTVTSPNCEEDITNVLEEGESSNYKEDVPQGNNEKPRFTDIPLEDQDFNDTASRSYTPEQLTDTLLSSEPIISSSISNENNSTIPRDGGEDGPRCSLVSEVLPKDHSSYQSGDEYDIKLKASESFSDEQNNRDSVCFPKEVIANKINSEVCENAIETHTDPHVSQKIPNVPNEAVIEEITSKPSPPSDANTVDADIVNPLVTDVEDLPAPVAVLSNPAIIASSKSCLVEAIDDEPAENFEEEFNSEITQNDGDTDATSTTEEKEPLTSITNESPECILIKSPSGTTNHNEAIDRSPVNESKDTAHHIITSEGLTTDREPSPNKAEAAISSEVKDTTSETDISEPLYSPNSKASNLEHSQTSPRLPRSREPSPEMNFWNTKGKYKALRTYQSDASKSPINIRCNESRGNTPEANSPTLEKGQNSTESPRETLKDISTESNENLSTLENSNMIPAQDESKLSDITNETLDNTKSEIDFLGFKIQSSFDEGSDFNGFEDQQEEERIRREIENLQEDSAANDAFLYASRRVSPGKTASPASKSSSDLDELEALEKEISQHCLAKNMEDNTKQESIEVTNNSETESSMVSVSNVVISTNDIEHIKKMLESDEEQPSDEMLEDKRTDILDIAEHEVDGLEGDKLSKNISSTNTIYAIPKLSDLCRAALNSSLNVRQITIVQTNDFVDKTHQNPSSPSHFSHTSPIIERELSVEEALAEMYRQAGVLLSDPEDNDNGQTSPTILSSNANVSSSDSVAERVTSKTTSNEAQDVLLINLHEILNSDNDVYVLQCDMNVNNDNVEDGDDDEANSDINNGDSKNGPKERVNTATTTTLQLIGIVNRDNDSSEIHIISSDSESEVIILSDCDTDVEFQAPPPPSPPPAAHREYIPFITDYEDTEDDSMSDLSTIHHEEIVPENLNKFLQEEFYKYLHEKYAQKKLSKYYHANRILRKYKKNRIGNKFRS